MPRLKVSGRIPLSGVPQGLDAMLLPLLARHMADVPLLHICVDDQRLSTLAEQVAYFAPDLEVLRFPAWDCLPYDRVSPSADTLARRLSTLTQLNRPTGKAPPGSGHGECRPPARRAAVRPSPNPLSPQPPATA